MKIVGKFKLGRNIYAIVLKNDKYRVGRLEGNLVNYNLSDEEKKVITVIVDKLLPKNNGIKIISLKINNTVYDINVCDNICMFNPVPNESDLIILNNIFNSQSECVYAGSFLNKDNKFIKRFLKLGKRTLLVLLSSTMLLSVSSSLKNDVEEQFDEKITKVEDTVLDDNKLITIIEKSDVELEDSEIIQEDELPKEVVSEIQSSIDTQVVKEEKIPSIDETELHEHFDFNDIIEAVNNNPNIGDKEKKLILSNKTIFEDNYGYYNYEDLLNKLKTLNINYVLEDIPGIDGTYSVFDNKIEFNNVSSLDEVDNYVFTHELSHLIQHTGNPFINYNLFLLEGTNAIANNEYYSPGQSNYDRCYIFQQSVIKILGEILGNDVIKKTYMGGKIDYINDSLCNLIQDKDRVENFRTLLMLYHSAYLAELDNNDFFLDINDIENEIKLELKYFYEIKFGRSIEDDLIMLYYMNERSFGKFNLEPFGDMSFVRCVSEKNYINTTEQSTFKISYPAEYSNWYTYISWEDAYEQGIAETTDYGLITLKDGYEIKDDYIHKVTRMPAPDTEYITVVIDESNRYLDQELSR